ncbi:hypothetical protein ABB55_06285 [Prosthecomicrobium hirschii]|uniref:Uncharacterized protein n=1 Tax=Prosthecodimorpha hirschii TaxID=665126 RepID=A0A0P6WBC1_9HYPH|nr:hypothetical protein [Prosthecomicrobium hirschii]KPL51883.1 hypothetical protein ABB55_06285 [Prosthecomicrobium hirschii]
MATITQVFTVSYVAGLLGEDPELVEAIIANDDNLTYGAIITVHTDTDEAILALTTDGIDEIKDMLESARRSDRTWTEFLNDFVSDPEIAARVKTKQLR